MKKTFKKAISVLLIAVMVLCSAPLAGFVGIELPEFNLFNTKAEAATSGTCGESIIWTFDEATGELVISGEGYMYDFESLSETPWCEYAESIKSVEISDGVTLIGGFAFSSCTSLTSVTIPESVFFIGPYAFDSCSGLTSVNIPSGVTEIGAAAFYFCKGLKNVTLPDSLTHIGAYAFKGCDSLTNITIPDSVISIGDEAFYSCDSLTSITIPGSVTYIEDFTFAYCVNLTDITIGNGVTEIGKAFSGCEKLTSITIPYSVEIIVDHAFGGCTSLTDVYFTGKESEWEQITIESYNDNLLNATIHFNENPRILTGTCGDNLIWTFDEATGILTIIGEGKIENWVFKYASYVTELIVSDGVTGIGAGVFSAFDSLTSVTIPDSVNYIGDGAFSWCYSLEEISLPAKIEYLGANAFEYCDLLSEVTVPDGVIELVETFVGCYSLSKVTLPASVTLINGAFEWGTILPDIYFQGSRTQWNSIEIHDDLSNSNIYYAFSQVTWNVDAETIVDLYEPGSIITVPENPVKEGCIFVGWDAEIPETAPDYDLVFNAGFTPNSYTVTWIVDGEETVVNYKNGDKLIVPETPTKEGWTFAGWGAEIPDVMPKEDLTFTAQWLINKHTVTWMFDGEETVVEYNYGDEIVPLEIPTKDEYTFVGWTPEVPATMPDCDLEFVAVWKMKLNTGTCGDNLTWTLDKETGELIISGTGKMNDFQYSYSAPWYNSRTYVKTVEIADGVTKIGNNAFAYCNNLTDITVPESVAAIGSNAFYNCYKLTGIEIPESVTVIDRNTFYGCEAFTSVSIPDSVTTIGESAFYRCSDLTSISIPDNVTVIGKNAFAGCTNLAQINVSADNTAYSSVDGVLFKKNETVLICYPENKAGASYTVPESVTTIGEGAFYSCNNLSDLTVFESLKKIEKNAFENHYKLSSVYYITDDNTYIGGMEEWVKIGFLGDNSNPLSVAENLYMNNVLLDGEVEFPDSITAIGDYAFYDCDGITSIIIPDSVTDIGDYAFYGCSELAEITLPDKKLKIGRDAFHNTSFSSDEGNSDGNAVYIGKHLVCISLDSVSGFTVKDGTISIASSTVRNKNPDSVTLPSTVEYIGEDGLGSNSYLKAIYFNGTRSQWSDVECATEYSASVFFGYSEEKEEDGFSYYINDEGNAVITGYSTSATGVLEIPDTLGGASVTEIADNAFRDCDYTEIIISDSVTVIGEKAFMNCNSLQNITLPSSLEYIGKKAFEQCKSLLQISLPSSLKYIGEEAFYNCYNLNYLYFEGDLEAWCGITFDGKYSNPMQYCDYSPYINGEQLVGDIVIPDTVTAIGDYTFCSFAKFNIDSITIPDSVTFIGDYAFYDCEITSISIPDSVKTIGNYAFGSCDKLESISIGKGLESIGTDVFNKCSCLTAIDVSEENPNFISDDGVMFTKDKKVLLFYPYLKSAETFEIPAETEKVSFAELTCAKYLKNITVNEENTEFTSVDGVIFSKDKTVIYCYPYAKTIKAYVIPYTVKTIAKDAFYIHSNGIRQLFVPKTVTCIDKEALYFNSYLSRTFFGGTQAEWKALLQNNYSNRSVFGTVYFDADSLVDDAGLIYSLNENSEASVIGYKTEPEGTVVIPSQINGYPVVSIGSSVFENCKNITEVIISDGIKKIGYRAFYYCSALETVVISDSVTTIDGSAFSNCNNIKNLTLGKGVTYISSGTFYCYNLENLYYTGSLADWFDIDNDSNPIRYADNFYINGVLLEGELVIPDSVSEIPDSVFGGYGKITSLIIPDSVTEIGKSSFESCGGLESVTIGSGITAISERAFYGCGALTRIDIPDNVINIGYESFASCTSLESVTIGSGVTTMQNRAFYNCDALKSIVVPDNVVNLGESTFAYSDSLESVTIGSGVTEIYSNTFIGCYSLKSYEISEDNPNYSNDECGVLFNKDKTHLLAYPYGRTEESYEIPASVTEVIPYALQYSENLKAITVNEGNEYYASIDGVLFSKDLTTLVCLSKGSVDNIYVIPDGVTTVLTGAIISYDIVRYLSIPETVTMLGESAISGNNSLSCIFFGGTQEEWEILKAQNGNSFYAKVYYNSSAGKDYSGGFTYYIDENLNATVISADKTVTGDVVIPDKLGGCPVVSIGDDVFEMNEALTSLTLPDTITSIGNNAFSYCINLKSINLPSSLETIGDEAFYCCVKLETVVIPASVTDIDINAYFDCINIKKFIVEDGNEHFWADENGVLYNADKTFLIQYPLNSPATDYVIPDTVSFVNMNGFVDARNLKTLTIPANAVDMEVGDHVYLGMNFEKFIVDENNSVYSSDEQGALYLGDKESLLCVPPAIQNKNFVVPDTVTDISQTAFIFCSDMTITLPDGLSKSTSWTPFGSAKEYIVSENNPYFSAHKGALYNKDKTVLIKYPTDSDADIYVAPASLKESSSYAFINADVQALYLYIGLFFMEEFNSDSLVSLADNLTVHASVPLIAHGVKQICVTDADEEYLKSANEELTDYLEIVRETYDRWNNIYINGGLDYFHSKIFYTEITKLCEKLLTTPDHVTVCGGEHSDVHTHNWIETVVEETCNVDGSITVVCTVCDETVVTVIPAGHKPGEWVTVTEPTVRAEGKREKYCTVCEEILEEETIPKLDIPATGINLKETEAEILNYTSCRLNAATVPAECNNTNILWSSNNESVATVDENGVVTAVSVGTAIITATTEDGGFSAECVVTVTPADFNVTLNVDGIQSVVTVKEGAVISVDNPVKEGYTFVGWTPVMPKIMPSEDLEFTAVFEISSYTVEWNIDGLVMSETYKFGDPIDKTKAFSKKGYTFVGWSPEIPDTMPAQNLEFTAVFEANFYDAVFNTNGGTFPDDDSIKRVPTAYNSAIAVPQSPERKGYEFAGWAYNGKNIGTNLGIMDSVEGKTFEAIWASNNTTLYKIETYTMNTLGEYEVSSIVLNATAFEEITVNPVASEGFEVNTEKSVLNGIVSPEEMLVLKVYLDRKQYSFTTVINSIKSSVLYYYGSIITEPATPVKDGYMFIGWDAEIPATMPANDVTVTAKFKTAPQDTTTPRIVMVTPETRTIYYGESITLQVRTYNLPEGARVKWEVSGDGVSIKPSASGKTCKVISTSNGNVVIRAYIIDSNGNTIAGKDGKPIYDYEYLYSEANFWQIIVNFFRQLFNKNASASQVFRYLF